MAHREPDSSGQIPSHGKIKVEDAIGTVLAHDITRIIPGKSKGVAFKKGHIVQAEDIPELLKIGKQSLYILALSDDELHEDDAALRIARAVAGPHLTWTDPKEGKSDIISQSDGLLKIEVDGLLQVNRLDNIIVATLKTHTPCRAGQKIASTRIIPLTIGVDKIRQVEAIAKRCEPVIQILPYRKMRVGGVVTGSEIYQGLIKDEFETFVGDKFLSYDCEFVQKVIVPDDANAIAEAIRKLQWLGCDLTVTTGGMSVDPDDVTRKGVRESGAEIINYGSPVLPGAMVLYAMLGEMRILGLPACVYYHKTTILDIMLPRILAGEPIDRDTFAELGHGGLCLECETCRFPNCGFGR